MAMNENLATDADLALYNVLFENDFAPIIITVMGFRARVEIVEKDTDMFVVQGVIRLVRVDGNTSSIGELKDITDWLVSDDELWDGFIAYKTIEAYKGVVG